MPLISLLTGTANHSPRSFPAKRTQRGQSLFRLLSGFVLASLATTAVQAAAAKTALKAPLVVTQVPVGAQASTTKWDTQRLVRSDWFDGARLVVVAPDGTVRILSEGFASACDPSVSFDGQKVLFAGRRTRGDQWRIWEIGLDGKDARPVTPENLEARGAIYVSALFTLNAPTPWPTTVFVGRDTSAGAAEGTATWNLYNVRLDGGDLRRLTFNLGHNLDPFQTKDGRLIYAAERIPTEPSAAGRRLGLFAVHIEGADNELYGGERGGRFQQMPCITADGLVVFVESEQPAWDGAGQLACVDQRRPHVTYRPITRDAAHAFLYPSPLAGNQLLVSRRAAKGGDTCGVFRLDATTGKCEPVFDDPKSHDVQAVLAAPRPQPDGHSTVVTTADNYGALYGLNCSTADAARQAGIRPGEIKHVRFLEGVAAAGASATAGAPLSRRLIGEAPVEADGSFNVELPADTPLQLQTLDERGLALGTCGWFWLKPRENRGCIGCHEDPELVPENNYVQALHRVPNRLVPPPEQRRGVTFRQNVAPILQKSCATAECHGGAKMKLPLPLAAAAPSDADLRQAYATLTAPAAKPSRDAKAGPAAGKYVDAGRARTSRLVWWLVGADTSRPWDHPAAKTQAPHETIHPMPKAGTGAALTAEELQTVIEWIDLGAQFEAPPSPATAQANQPK